MIIYYKPDRLERQNHQKNNRNFLWVLNLASRKKGEKKLRIRCVQRVGLKWLNGGRSVCMDSRAKKTCLRDTVVRTKSDLFLFFSKPAELTLGCQSSAQTKSLSPFFKLK